LELALSRFCLSRHCPPARLQPFLPPRNLIDWQWYCAFHRAWHGCRSLVSFFPPASSAAEVSTYGRVPEHDKPWRPNAFGENTPHTVRGAVSVPYRMQATRRHLQRASHEAVALFNTRCQTFVIVFLVRFSYSNRVVSVTPAADRCSQTNQPARVRRARTHAGSQRGGVRHV
jgi:hypothetical protein